MKEHVTATTDFFFSFREGKKKEKKKEIKKKRERKKEKKKNMAQI